MIGIRTPKWPRSTNTLMDREAEIALARGAAPESISLDATVVVLGRHGYETAIEGKNGFVCGVDRSWTQRFDQLEFWNPKVRGAVCFNRRPFRSAHHIPPGADGPGGSFQGADGC